MNPNDISSILDADATGKLAVVTPKGGTPRELDVMAIKDKIAEMNTALLSAHPTMPILLRDIHNHLRRDPELVTIISEEEIGMIVNGLKQQTKTALVTATVKTSKTAAGKKTIAKLTVDDL